MEVQEKNRLILMGELICVILDELNSTFIIFD